MEIISQTCEKYGISIDELCGSKKNATFVSARREIAIELRKANYSFPSIGNILNRDHSTIVHYINPTPSHKPKRGCVERNNQRE